MIPDFEQRLDEKMKQASINELMPDFDKNAEWLALSAKLSPAPPRKNLVPKYWAAAAILLLVAGASWLVVVLQNDKPSTFAAYNLPVDSNRSAPFSPTSFQNYFQSAEQEKLPVAATVDRMTHEFATVDRQPPITVKQQVAIQSKEMRITHLDKIHGGAKRKNIGTDKWDAIGFSGKEYICNSTPCPIQICITQTMKCKDNAPSAISTVSIIEPEKTSKLSYKSHDKVAKDCSLTVNEIEIKSIATGETIVLNAHSSPATAQDVFSYITRQKKGDILAGVFKSDCDNHPNANGLRIDNKFGDLILQ